MKASLSMAGGIFRLRVGEHLAPLAPEHANALHIPHADIQPGYRVNILSR